MTHTWTCRAFVLTGLLAVLMMQGAPASGGPRTVEIADPAGLTWTDELVHYDFAFKLGELKGRASARVTPAKGSPVPSQVSDVEAYPDGSIRSMKVWFLATVPSNATLTFAIEPGKDGPTVEGVTVKTVEKGLELSTATTGGRIGIRLAAGEESFAWPVPAAGVAGPIQGLLLPSGREAGRGRWDVPFTVYSRRTEIVAEGPLFAEARVRYQFDVGTWTLSARVIKGCPMIVIQEDVRTGESGLKWNAFDRFFSLVFDGNGFKPEQVYFTGRSDLADLNTLFKEKIPEPWAALLRCRGNWFASPVNGFVPNYKEDRVDFRILGYPSVIPRVSCLARFVEPGKDAIGFAGLSTAQWRNPLGLWVTETTNREMLVRLPVQGYAQDWSTEGFGASSPNYTGRTLEVPSGESRRTYGIMLSPAEAETDLPLASLFALGSKLGSFPLDVVKDWVVEWPDPMAGAAWGQGPTAAGTNELQMLRDKMAGYQQLGHYAQFSMGFHYHFAKSQYDALQKIINDPAALTASERKEMRRLCAYVATDMHRVDRFPWGTGFHLNNPNMSIMAMEARAKSALLVNDHPESKAWGVWTREFIRDYNRRFVFESGATYENPHYTLGVTLANMLEVNDILMKAGQGDALDDPRFRSCSRYLLDWATPPDPRFFGHRVVLPMGNCSYQSVPPAFTRAMVTYYQSRDVELAGQLEWFGNQTVSNETDKVRLVAEKVPPLTSTWYKDYGVSFRHGFGTPYETLFLLYAGRCDGHYEWEADQMSYTYYAKGQPINLHFGNGYFPMFGRPWLRNRVSIDHKFEVSERNITRVEAAAFAPDAEYARAMRQLDQIRPLKGEYPILDGTGKWSPEEGLNWPAVATNIETIPPVIWYRQVLFVKDVDPKGPNYFVLRESFSGTPVRPTDLSFWFLANEMTRQGDVYHFNGQCEVDMDVFVNTPAVSEPETGRYSHVQQPYGRMVGFDPKYHPDGKLQEMQLFMRLRQPAGKGYMVVLYPRLKAGDPAAVCTRLDDGAVKVETPVSTDYIFMGSQPFAFKNDQVAFDGMAGTVRFFKSGKVVVVSGEGHAVLKVGGRTITADGPGEVILQGGAVERKPLSPTARLEVGP